jgi:hydrogenase-1 operon protein HyaE
MDPSPHASPDISRLLTLFARLVSRHGFQAPANVAEFVAAPGAALVFFAEDPKRVPETWDVAVVLPDIVSLSPCPLRVGLLDPAASRAAAANYGVQVWPTLVFTREGQKIGAIERMQGWSEYRELLTAILKPELEIS